MAIDDRQAKIIFLGQLPLHSLTVILVCLFASTAAVEMVVSSGIILMASQEENTAIRNEVGLAFEESMLRYGPLFLKKLLNDEDEAKAYVTTTHNVLALISGQ